MRSFGVFAALLALPGCILIDGDGRGDGPDQVVIERVLDTKPAQHFRGVDWPETSNPPYSAAVVHGDTIHLAGTLGFTPGTSELPEGVEPQANNALNAIGANLERFGADMSDLVACTCYLADIEDYGAFNAVYSAFFPEDPPARTTVAVAGLPLGAAVEITCIADKP